MLAEPSLYGECRGHWFLPPWCPRRVKVAPEKSASALRPRGPPRSRESGSPGLPVADPAGFPTLPAPDRRTRAATDVKRDKKQRRRRRRRQQQQQQQQHKASASFVSSGVFTCRLFVHTSKPSSSLPLRSSAPSSASKSPHPSAAQLPSPSVGASRVSLAPAFRDCERTDARPEPDYPPLWNRLSLTLFSPLFPPPPTHTHPPVPSSPKPRLTAFGPPRTKNKTRDA
jgi:hypothetical protein